MGEALVRARIARGSMPATLEGLLEQRGTIENAALDFSQFAGLPYMTALAALRRVYHG